jgi:hypothetical protein
MRSDDTVAYTIKADVCRGYLWQLDIYDGELEGNAEPTGAIKKLYSHSLPSDNELVVA